MARGLEATNGYNPLRIGSYDRLVSPGETTHLVDQRLFPASFDGYDCALARELGLEYLVLGRPIEEVPHLMRRPVSDVLLAGPKVWIYRLRPAEPRVKFIKRVVVADADAQVRAGRYTISPAGEMAQIDDGTAPVHVYWPAGGRRDRGWADILSWGPDRLEIEVESDQPGIVMVPRRRGERGAPRRRVPLRAVLARQPAQRLHGAVFRSALISRRGCGVGTGAAAQWIVWIARQLAPAAIVVRSGVLRAFGDGRGQGA
jgi:hypothetical protein